MRTLQHLITKINNDKDILMIFDAALGAWNQGVVANLKRERRLTPADMTCHCKEIAQMHNLQTCYDPLIHVRQVSSNKITPFGRDCHNIHIIFSR